MRGSIRGDGPPPAQAHHYAVIVSDAHGREMERVNDLTADAAVQLYDRKRRLLPSLNITILDMNTHSVIDNVQLARSIYPTVQGRSYDPKAINREWQERQREQRRQALLERQLDGSRTCDIEVRAEKRDTLYGYITVSVRDAYFGSFSVPRTISFAVAEPDVAQVVRAIREGRTTEYEDLPITPQRKSFGVTTKTNGTLIRLVCYIDPPEIWTALRDPEFRRAPSFPPARPDDLSWRDIQILASVRTYGKIRRDIGAEAEADILVASGLILRSSGGDQLNLTQKGSEFIKAVQERRS